MEEADIEAVAKLEQLCFSMPWSEAAFREALTDEHKCFVVAVEDGEVLGYCGMSHVLGEGEITNVAVWPKVRGRKIGKGLMDTMFACGRELLVTCYFLEVRESNAPARALYENCGFAVDGIRKNFYEKPVENAVLMSFCP